MSPLFLLALSAPVAVSGQYFADPGAVYYGAPTVFSQPMYVQPASYDPWAFAAAQPAPSVAMAPAMDQMMISEMTEAHKEKIEGDIEKQRAKATTQAAEQKNDIQSLLLHDQSLKTARIDAELQKTVEELTIAAQKRKTALTDTTTEKIKAQFIEVDRNLERDLSSIDIAGKQQMLAMVQTQSVLMSHR